METWAACAVSMGINLIESSHSRLTFISRSPHCRASIEARSFAFVAIATDWQIPRSSLRFIVPFNPICWPRLSVSHIYIYIYVSTMCSVSRYHGYFLPPHFSRSSLAFAIFYYDAINAAIACSRTVDCRYVNRPTLAKRGNIYLKIVTRIARFVLAFV